ncbi:MAG: hypothetical protein KGR26_12730, partial [Cyanobacteria bacterium REEB65]|nr:hypothetical protein [Cyanobacteria bacterium REEB65]
MIEAALALSVATASPTVPPVPPALSLASASAGLPDEKLPVELPAITVIGHQGELPDAGSGRKLAPDAAAQLRILPPPAPDRATNDFLSQLELAVPHAPLPGANLPNPSDRQPLTQAWGALGSLPLLFGGPRYDFGLSHGQAFGSLISLTDLAANSNGLDQWSSLQAQERLAWGDDGWAQLSYRRNQQAPGSQTSLQEGGAAEADWQQDRLKLHLGLDLGHVQVWPVEALGTAPSVSSLDESWLYDVGAMGSYSPDLRWPGHALRLTGILGQQGSSETGLAGWSAPHVAAGASDTWSINPLWGLQYGLGAATMRQVTYLDPRAKLLYHPGAAADLSATGPLHDSPTTVWLGLQTHTDF